VFAQNRQDGFTLVEMLVVFALIGALSGIAVINLKAFSSPAENGAAQLLGFLKQARARAISTTSAYFVVPSGSATVVTRYGTNCSDASPVSDASLTLQMPTGAQLAATGWSICFTARGLSDSNTVLTVNDNQSGARSVEVLLGGSVRLQTS
jgi:prepilin-type N-terminal cleavage/methylation domain-containing protein